MPKTVKGGPLRFFNNHSVAKFQKMKGNPLKSLKFFRKKTKNENFEQSHSAENSEKRDTLGFSTFVLLQNIKKIERRTLWGDLKKFEKKSHKAEKSHSAEK